MSASFYFALDAEANSYIMCLHTFLKLSRQTILGIAIHVLGTLHISVVDSVGGG